MILPPRYNNFPEQFGKQKQQLLTLFYYFTSSTVNSQPLEKKNKKLKGRYMREKERIFLSFLSDSNSPSSKGSDTVNRLCY